MPTFCDNYLRQSQAGNEFPGSGGAESARTHRERHQMLQQFVGGTMEEVDPSCSGSLVSTIVSISVSENGDLQIHGRDRYLETAGKPPRSEEKYCK